jgi:hypothetical protein
VCVCVCVCACACACVRACVRKSPCLPAAPLTKKNRVKFSFIDDRELAAREVFLREMEVLVKEYRDTMASPKTQEKLMADQKKVHSVFVFLQRVDVSVCSIIEDAHVAHGASQSRERLPYHSRNRERKSSGYPCLNARLALCERWCVECVLGGRGCAMCRR